MIIRKLICAFPLGRSHARDGLEGTEERGLGGEARLHPDLGDLHIGLSTYQVFGMLYTITVHKLREGAALLTVDTT